MHETDYIGEWLRTQRRKLGIKQRELAEWTGVTRTIIADLECDRMRPSRLCETVLVNYINYLNRKTEMKEEYEKYGPDWRRFLMKHSIANLVELFKPEPDSYSTKEELISHIRAKLIVKEFNEKHGVGTMVQWRNSRVQVSRPMTVQTPAYVKDNIPVVFFQEKSGYCSVEPQFLEG